MNKYATGSTNMKNTPISDKIFELQKLTAALFAFNVVLAPTSLMATLTILSFYETPSWQIDLSQQVLTLGLKVLFFLQ